MGLEDDFLLADADDEKTIEFIKNYLPQELKEKFSDDELYYFLDLIDEYYSESGILDAQPDEDGYVNIDLERCSGACNFRGGQDILFRWTGHLQCRI